MKINQIKSKFLGGSFDQNTYVLSNENFAILVDAGANLEDILKFTKNKKVLAVLITHLHFDHIWNLKSILDYFDCDVYIVSGFDDYFNNPLKNVSKVFGLNLSFEISKSKIKYYSKEMNLGDFKIQIFSTPGHSKDSVCIKIAENLFTGDTVFDGNVGRTDLFGASTDELNESLKTIELIDFKYAFPGHGDACSKQDILQTIYYEIG